MQRLIALILTVCVLSFSTLAHGDNSHFDSKQDVTVKVTKVTLFLIEPHEMVARCWRKGRRPGFSKPASWRAGICQESTAPSSLTD